MLKQIVAGLAVACMFTGLVVAEEIEVGAKAPDFSIQGVDGKSYTMDSFKDSDVVVVCFTCNQCPVAVAYEDRFIEFAEKYKGKKVSFVAINCNNRSENLDVMKERAEEKGFNFVYAFDEAGKSAEAFGARVTPHMFIVSDGKVQYRGAFDDNMKEPKTHYVSMAVDALLNGDAPKTTSTKAVGCGIKMKK